MAKKNPSFIKNVCVLLGVALVAVSLLAVVYQITLKPIEAADELARMETYQKVMEAESFEDVKDFDALLKDYSKNQLSQNTVINAALEAKDKSGNNIGYVIDATSKSGYGGDVRVAIGISADGTLTAFSVVEHSETPGLGAKSTEPEFSDQFKGMTAGTFRHSKQEIEADNTIDALSGATITTNAVTEAVNEASAFYNNMLKGE